MQIIIKIGPNVMKLFWALIALLGVILVSSGFFNGFSGLQSFGETGVNQTMASSQISGGIVLFALGFAMVAVGYIGVRGRIIFISNDEIKQNPS